MDWRWQKATDDLNKISSNSSVHVCVPRTQCCFFIWLLGSSSAYDLTFSSIFVMSHNILVRWDLVIQHTARIKPSHSHGIGEAVNMITFLRFIINRITCLSAPTWQTVAMTVKPTFSNYCSSVEPIDFTLCRCLIHFCTISVWFIHVKVPGALIFCTDIKIAIM